MTTTQNTDKYFYTQERENGKVCKTKILTASVLAAILGMGALFANNEVEAADFTWRKNKSGNYSGSIGSWTGNVYFQGGNNFTVTGIVTGNIQLTRGNRWGHIGRLYIAPNGCTETITLSGGSSQNNSAVYFNRAGNGNLTCNINGGGASYGYFQVAINNSNNKYISIQNLYLQSTLTTNADYVYRKSGNISNTGNLILTGGTFKSNLTSGGTLTIDTGADVTMSYRSDNKIQLKDNATLTISASNINHAEGIFASGAGSKVVLNGGTLAKQIVGSAALDITGTVTAPLSLFNTPDTMGDWTVTDTGNFILTDGVLTKTIANNGTVTLKGATLGNETAVTSGTLKVAADAVFSADYVKADTNIIDSGAILTLTDGTLDRDLQGNGQLVIAGDVTTEKKIELSHTALPAAQEAAYYDITVADGGKLTLTSTDATTGKITGKILNQTGGTISVKDATILNGMDNVKNLGTLQIEKGTLTRSISGDDAGVLLFGTGTENKTVTVQNNVAHDFKVLDKTTLNIGAGMIQGDVTLDPVNTQVIINASGTMDKTIKGEAGTIVVNSDMKLGKNARLDNTGLNIFINKKVSMAERSNDSDVEINILNMNNTGYLDIADNAAEHLQINMLNASDGAKLYLDMVKDNADYSVKMDTISANSILGNSITIDGINVAYELLDHDDSKPLFSNTLKAAGLAKFDLDVLNNLILDEDGDSGSALMVYGGYIFEFKRAKVTDDGKVISLKSGTEIDTTKYMNAKAGGSFQTALTAVKPESGEQGVFFIEKRKGFDLRDIIQAKIVKVGEAQVEFDTGKVRSYQFFSDMLNMSDRVVDTSAVADAFFGMNEINYKLGGGDLGILTREGMRTYGDSNDGGVIGSNPPHPTTRTFTLGGRNTMFIGGQNKGVTIQEGDTLRFGNFSMIDDFKNGVFAVNDGTFEFINGNTLFNASITDTTSVPTSPYPYPTTLATNGTVVINGANVMLGDYGHKFDIEKVSIIGVNVHGAKPTPDDPTKTVYVDQYVGLFDVGEYIEIMAEPQKSMIVSMIIEMIKQAMGGVLPPELTVEMLQNCFKPDSELNPMEKMVKNTIKENYLNAFLQKDLGTIRLKIDQEISTTEAYPVFISQKDLQIAEGSLIANANQLFISNEIQNGDKLVLTGGTLKATVTNYTNTEVTPPQPVIGTVCIGDGSAVQQTVKFDPSTTIANNILYVNTNGTLQTEPASLPHMGLYSVATMNEGILQLQGGDASNYKILEADQIITGGGKIEIDGFVKSEAPLTNNVDVLADKALKIQPELVLSQMVNLQNDAKIILDTDGTFNGRVVGQNGTVELAKNIKWGEQANISSNGVVNLHIPKDGHLDLVNNTADNFVVTGHFTAGTSEADGTTYKWENAGHTSIDIINDASMDLLTVQNGAEGKLIIDEVKMAGELMSEVNDMNIASMGNKLFFPLDIQGTNTLQIAGKDSTSTEIHRVAAVLDNYYYTFDQVVVHKDANPNDEVNATLNYFNFINPAEDGEFIDPATLAGTYNFDIALAKAQSTGQPVQGIMVTKGTGFNLRQILHNYELAVPGGSLKGAEISTYSFSKDTINIDKVEIDTTAKTAQINIGTGSIVMGGGDLGILTRKSVAYQEGGQTGGTDGETREFMFNGNGHAFYGGQFAGITVQEDDTLTFNDVSMLDDFQGGKAVINDGTVEFTNSYKTQLNASIVSGTDGKGTVSIENAEVVLAEKSTNYNFKGTLVEPNTTNSFAVSKDGKVYYVLPEVESTTEGEPVIIKQANLDIMETGSLIAKADQLQISSEISNNGLLVFEGGTLNSKVTGFGCTLIDKPMAIGSTGKIQIGFDEMGDISVDPGVYVPPTPPTEQIYVGQGSVLMVNADAANKDTNPNGAITNVGTASIKFENGNLYLTNLTAEGTYIIFSGDGVDSSTVYVPPNEVLMDNRFYKLTVATDLGANKFGYKAQINTIEGVYGPDATVTPSVWNDVMQGSEGTKAYDFIKKVIQNSTTMSGGGQAGINTLNAVSEMSGAAAVNQSVVSITNYAFAEMVANNNLMARPANTFSQPHAMHTSAENGRRLKIDTVEQGKAGEVVPNAYKLPIYE
ncbi:MAG: hypothetical protein MJ048_00940 [Acidaminococcaceae bacterium]|nr:hypothetical protein [Acidaminococcaceae bacterium]